MANTPPSSGGNSRPSGGARPGSRTATPRPVANTPSSFPRVGYGPRPGPPSPAPPPPSPVPPPPSPATAPASPASPAAIPAGPAAAPAAAAAGGAGGGVGLLPIAAGAAAGAIAFLWGHEPAGEVPRPPEPPQPIEPGTVPFTGGQSPVFYKVEVQYTAIKIDTDPIYNHLPPSVTGTRTAYVYGPIAGLSSRNHATPEGKYTDHIVLRYPKPPDTEPNNDRWDEIAGTSPEYRFRSFAITQITRLDGQPDTGGDPPPINQPINSPPGQTLRSPSPPPEVGSNPPPQRATPQQPQRIASPAPAPASPTTPQINAPTQPPELQPQRPAAPPVVIPTPTAPATGTPPVGTPTLTGPAANPGTTTTTSSFGATNAPPVTAPTPPAPAPPNSVPFAPSPSGDPVPATPTQPTPQPPTTPTDEPELTDVERMRRDLERRITELGLPLVGITQLLNPIATNTTPEALRNAARDGVCQTTQPGGCTTNALNRSNENLRDWLRNNGLDAATLAQGQDTNTRVRNIEQKIGADEYPMILPEYLLDGVQVPTTIANQAQFNAWSLKQWDALIGLFPIKIERTDENGAKQMLTYENVAEAIAEITGLLAQIAFDADTAVNVATRAVAEAIGAKIAALQAGSYVNAIIDHLGFQTQSTALTIPISVTPGAVGLDGKLQENELKDFLKPSTKQAIGLKNTDPVDQRLVLRRILEDAEIVRAALYRPLKPNAKDNPLTGDAIKADKAKDKKRVDDAWEAFKTRYEGHTAGTEIDIDDNKSSTDPTQ